MKNIQFKASLEKKPVEGSAYQVKRLLESDWEYVNLMARRYWLAAQVQSKLVTHQRQNIFFDKTLLAGFSRCFAEVCQYDAFSGNA